MPAETISEAGEAIQPCPFCGKAPEVFPSGDGTGTMIECITPGCVNPHTSYYGEGTAAKVWNTRAFTARVAVAPEAQTGEKAEAIRLANIVLDRPSHDPDDDLAVLARQFLRAIEPRPADLAVAVAPEAAERPKVHHLGAALQGIADEHADVLTPRQVEALYQAAHNLWAPEAADPAVEGVPPGIMALCEHPYSPDDMLLHNAPGFEFTVGDLRTLLAALARSVGPDLRGVVENCRERLLTSARFIDCAASDLVTVAARMDARTEAERNREMADLCSRALGEAR